MERATAADRDRESFAKPELLVLDESTNHLDIAPSPDG